MARWRFVVLGATALVTVLSGAGFAALEDRLGGMDFGVAGAESAQVDAVLAENFPQFGTEQNVVVFESAGSTVDAPEFRTAVDRVLAALDRVPGVRYTESSFGGSAGALVSPDRRVALAVLGLDGDMAERAAIAGDVQAQAAESDDMGIVVGVTGFSPVQNDATETQNADLQRAESIGIPVALGLLVFALGTVVSAVVPVGTALVGLAIAAGVMFLLSSLVPLDSLTVAMATMIGIGVGIDYAMFVVSRFREELARRAVVQRDQHEQIADAVGAALATAGKTVVVSGVIVMISLCALAVMDAPIFRGIALGVATAVTAMLAVSLTALPATLAWLGPWVGRGALPPRFQPAEVAGRGAATSDRWGRWARMVMARPAIFGAAASVVLIVAALPLLGIRYGLDMGTAALSDTPSGRAAATLAQSFPSGVLAPIEVVASGPDDTVLTEAMRTDVTDFIGAAAADDRVATVLPPADNNGRRTVSIVAAVPFDSAAAVDLIGDLRAIADTTGQANGTQILIGGTTAEFVDLADEMTSKLPLVIALVLASSLIFLIAAFRSIALPVKAIALNLLATAATLGITIAVFQWGVGERLLDFTSPGFVQTYLPTLVFAVLFGLSMDYEVFLIRRIREYWLHDKDNQQAVAAGLSHTARPISAAAAIMVVVFGSFVTADVLELKQIGFALATAVAIDAIVVRLLLVPALMQLLGDWNWWLPSLRRLRVPAGRRSAESVGSSLT